MREASGASFPERVIISWFYFYGFRFKHARSPSQIFPELCAVIIRQMLIFKISKAIKTLSQEN